jgi:hypothetical protein
MLPNKWLSVSLRRTAFFGMILVLLAVFFTQFAIAQNGNISLSGTTFLDKDSDKEFSPGDNPLSGIEIYVDKNGNSNLDLNEFYTKSSKNGIYNFTEIPREGFVRVRLSNESQTFYPKEYELKNLTPGLENKLNFSIEEQTVPKDAAAENAAAKKADANKSGLGQNINFLYALAFVFGLISLFGCWIIYRSLDVLYNQAKNEPKNTTMQILQIISGFVLLFLGMFLLMSLVQMPAYTIGAETGQNLSFSIVLPVVLALLLFGAVLIMLYAQTEMKKTDKNQDDTGGMRKTIAGLLVVGLIAVVLFALSGKIENDNQNIITQYIQLVGIVIAFYFGSKATSDAYRKTDKAGKAGADVDDDVDDKGKALEDLEIRDVSFDSSKNQIIISGPDVKKAFDASKVCIKQGETTLLNKEFGPVTVPEKLALNLPIQLSKDEIDAKKLNDSEYVITLGTTNKEERPFSHKITKKS